MSIIEVKVPQLSESVAEATLLQWKKKVGDAVANPLLQLPPPPLQRHRHRHRPAPVMPVWPCPRPPS